MILLTAFLSLPACADTDSEKVEETTEDIRWGKHWAGSEVKAPADLKGKVVLLKVWGG